MNQIIPKKPPLTSKHKIYYDRGNLPLLELLDNTCHKILDVGCGAGGNARLLSQLRPNLKIYGITISSDEAAIASQYMEKCWVADIEESDLGFLDGYSFECLLMSHVLEHLREPDIQLARLGNFLKVGGSLLIAVPNIVFFQQRVKSMCGIFEYEETGITDKTHLRFFTYYTADKYLFKATPEIKLLSKGVTGSLPFGKLRRYFLPSKVNAWFDRLGCAMFPNLFGSQIILKATKIR